jgi:hypothetical protein
MKNNTKFLCFKFFFSNTDAQLAGSDTIRDMIIPITRDNTLTFLTKALSS